jgi:hypothetical protein
MFRFRAYFQDEAELAELTKHGLTPTRIINTDGSVPVSYWVDDERFAPILSVAPNARRKRTAAWDMPDEGRDEIAQWVADALNYYAAAGFAVPEAVTNKALQIGGDE